MSGSATIGGLTLGGRTGHAELDFDSGTFAIGGSSTIADTGLMTSHGWGVMIVQTGTLTNHGVLEPGGAGIQFVGNLVNAPDGLILGVGSNLFFDGPGTFTNDGEFSLTAGFTFASPHGSGTGVTFVNAGTVQNDTSSGDGAFTVGPGGTFKETTGTVTGAALDINGAALDLAGPGTSRFLLLGAVSISGTVAAGQTLLLDSHAVTTAASLTNKGTITGVGFGGEITVPTGHALINDGSIMGWPGSNFVMTGNLDNAPSGRIDLTRNSGGYTSGLQMNGPFTLTNRGTIIVSANSGLTTQGPNSSAGTIYNAGGTIENDGTVSAANGGTFIEGNGTTTGHPISVTSGSLKLQGSGASQFVVSQQFTSGTTTGNIAPGQVLHVLGMNATGSFTNNGTMIAGHVFLPAGDTLTNNGMISVDQGQLLLRGNLDNSASGVIGEQGNVTLSAANTKFTNEGVLYLLFGGGSSSIALGVCNCGPDHNQFINAGKIYFGVEPNSSQWGGVTLAANINEGDSETVDLGGVFVPVPLGEPPVPPASPATMGYDITAKSTGNPPQWTLTCPGGAADGWSLSCNGIGELIDPSNRSLIPTEIAVTGSGASVGSGWAATYGQQVKLKATVSAQSGPAPTGMVTFFAYTQPAGNPVLVRRDILGTAPLSTSGGVTTATLKLKNMRPGEYQLAVFYSGSTTDLPASSSYNPYINQTVNQSATTTTLTARPSSSAFGSPVTLTAHVKPAFSGARLKGSVFFEAGNLPIGSAPVKTAKGKTTARITTSALLIGRTSITASYGGVYNYANSDSLPKTVTVTAPQVPTSVKVKGPNYVAAGSTYKATSITNATGAVSFSLAANATTPKKLTINSATGKVTFKTPAKGLTLFSYSVVASNAAGRAKSTPVTVRVS
ncbi:MAG TPA: Ig-like domain-containing protein [Chloroflexota bacterium]|nr:Ig-like domain-containing protein [Chloroflexota bacterium]